MADPYDTEEDQPNVPALRRAYSQAVLTGTDPGTLPEEQRQVAAAQHQMQWANTFTNTPPTEVLRSRRDYVDLVNQAAERKMQLLSQTDKHAQDLYFGAKRFEYEQNVENPMKEAMREADIVAKRYNATKGIVTANDTSEFIKRIGAIDAKPGSREYMKAAIDIAADHPYAMTTEVGKQILKDNAQFHDISSQINAAREAVAPLGQTIESVDITKEGTPNIRFQSQDKVMREQLKGRGLTPEQIKNPIKVEVGELDKNNKPVGKDDGSLVFVHTGKQGAESVVAMPKSEYLSLGGKLDQKHLTFSNEEEANASNLPKGTKIKINGKNAEIE